MPEENKLTTTESGFELTQTAKQDIKEVWLYIAEHNQTSADKLISELFDKFHLLAENTKLGKERNEILLKLRSFPHKHHIIFYLETTPNQIEIYRIIHASRDFEGLFEEYFEGLKE